MEFAGAHRSTTVPSGYTACAAQLDFSAATEDSPTMRSTAARVAAIRSECSTRHRAAVSRRPGTSSTSRVLPGKRLHTRNLSRTRAFLVGATERMVGAERMSVAATTARARRLRASASLGILLRLVHLSIVKSLEQARSATPCAILEIHNKLRIGHTRLLLAPV